MAAWDEASTELSIYGQLETHKKRATTPGLPGVQPGLYHLW